MADPESILYHEHLAQGRNAPCIEQQHTTGNQQHTYSHSGAVKLKHSTSMGLLM